jgi:DNA polymerase-3 subunit epsilon
LLDYLRDAELIIHNAPFDISFLNKELDRLGRPPLKTVIGSVIDSLVMAKEMFPGKRNGLDALCDRLGVDNSGRTLHGALLDAELLADVYINMTRGQDALIMDLETPTGEGGEVVLVDLSGIELPVLRANEQEALAHDTVLAEIDKACRGQAVWRQLQLA